MIEIDTPEQLTDMVGKTIGPGHWVEISQSRIDAFADATDDAIPLHAIEEDALLLLPPIISIAIAGVVSN